MDINRFMKNAQLLNQLERICQALELTETQHKKAKSSYEAVGDWLEASEHPQLTKASIYPQGSIKIGTTVRPLGSDEFDVDLVCFVPNVSSQTPPGELKKLVGDRLKSHGTYSKPGMLEEKPRCWRLNYSGDFHMDITPSIHNPTCLYNGELVPDKRMSEWKASNPKGYAAWFEKHAVLQPAFVINEAQFAELKKSVEAFPEQETFKSILKRCVQLFKRHRDIYFENKNRNSELAPISVILTTLAAKSYGYCVNKGAYETEFDFLLDVLREMPKFIETQNTSGRTEYFVMNETTDGENFAEKWNQDEGQLANSFFQWREAALAEIEQFMMISGLDKLSESFTKAFGKNVTDRAMNGALDEVNKARDNKMLKISSAVGVVAGGSGGSKGSSVRPNTFYGK
jgi:hypothetical protein